MENNLTKIEIGIESSRSKMMDLVLALKKLNENKNTSEGGFYVAQDRIHIELNRIFEQFPELEKEYEDM